VSAAAARPHRAGQCQYAAAQAALQAGDLAAFARQIEAWPDARGVGRHAVRRRGAAWRSLRPPCSPSRDGRSGRGASGAARIRTRAHSRTRPGAGASPAPASGSPPPANRPRPEMAGTLLVDGRAVRTASRIPVSRGSTAGSCAGSSWCRGAAWRDLRGARRLLATRAVSPRRGSSGGPRRGYLAAAGTRRRRRDPRQTCLAAAYPLRRGVRPVFSHASRRRRRRLCRLKCGGGSAVTARTG